MSTGGSALRPRRRHMRPMLRRPLLVVSLVLAGLALVAAPSWAIWISGQPTSGTTGSHRPPGSLNGTISAGGTLLSVSCSRDSSCVAVGDNQTRSGPRALATARDDGKLRVTATPQGDDAAGALLSAVSCPAADRCVAVGTYFTSTGRSRPLAESWNGSRWRTMATPSPKANGGVGSALTGVSCLSFRNCIAVGDNQTSSGVVTLAEKWDGSRWRILATLNAPKARVSMLNQVACSGARACTAVGTYTDAANGGFALAERWDGAKWSIQAAASVRDATASVLWGVSCPAANACVAVGNSQGGQSLMLTETWDGAAWQIRSAPNPDHGLASGLANVSCHSAAKCTAVGYYQRGSGDYVTLIEAWNGTTWLVQSSPNRGTRSDLYGVSCPASKRCFAVGGYTTGSGKRVTLAEVWNGSVWSVQAAPDS